ncbi:MAG: hypothetical protein ABSE82_03575 [Nitrososphaerales archaeon]
MQSKDKATNFGSSTKTPVGKITPTSFGFDARLSGLRGLAAFGVIFVHLNSFSVTVFSIYSFMFRAY